MELYIEQFKALGDKTRLAIMWLLNSVPGDLCVCEITDAIGESHCNISRHLKILKGAKLVKEKKEGRWVYFDLAKPQDQVHGYILQALATIPAEAFLEMTARLQLRLSLREGNRCVDGVKSDKWRRAVNKISSPAVGMEREISECGVKGV
ncbi:MAG TPA: metalloregulator ArsR/SmtB family transcription factor [Syntrophales bacterium]|nr:metalloregulator ArsR/SmtB family transcription factor [Syntrophales bacterium]HQG35154.1 metalloregulator ArsR/SmtB family transcription factor [Syntrophales bacterium]HRR47811.1 metalloregulator ArsR/SmtB family transcription factor [Syntrophales bacterium]HRU89406.1 metalloregulator ArsR/SmtB family transcription factor [Syntrophales bacterium]